MHLKRRAYLGEMGGAFDGRLRAKLALIDDASFNPEMPGENSSFQYHLENACLTHVFYYNQ